MPSTIFNAPCPARNTKPSQYPRRTVLAGLSATIAAKAHAQTPDPHIIVVFGDSQAEGLAAGLRRVSHQFPGTKIQNRTKPGTAISQPQTYDWPAAIRDYTPEPAVTTAVLMFGGNDRVPMRPPAGPTIPFATQAYSDIYHTEVAAILHSLADKKLHVIWVSQPICQEPRYSRDMAYLNTIFRQETASENATFLDIWTAIADGDQFTAYGKTLTGATARLRLDDGIHFTPSGYDIIATRVMQTIEAPPDAPK
jgi:hypothetical protein